MPSNNLTYEEIDVYLFSSIVWFKEYFFASGHDIDDLSIKYTVMGALGCFLQDNYLDKKMNIVGNMTEFRILIKTLDIIYVDWDQKLQELVCMWFIENFLSDDMEKMRKFKSILRYDSLRGCMVELYKFWYRLDI